MIIIQIITIILKKIITIKYTSKCDVDGKKSDKPGQLGDPMDTSRPYISQYHSFGQIYLNVAELLNNFLSNFLRIRQQLVVNDLFLGLVPEAAVLLLHDFSVQTSRLGLKDTHSYSLRQVTEAH